MVSLYKEGEGLLMVHDLPEPNEADEDRVLTGEERGEEVREEAEPKWTLVPALLFGLVVVSQMKGPWDCVKSFPSVTYGKGELLASLRVSSSLFLDRHKYREICDPSPTTTWS